jgi:hypothetical protein
MARTIIEIHEALKANYVQERAQVGLPYDDPAIWSLASRKRLWSYIVAVAIWVMEVLYDTLRTEVDDTISRMKPHSERWYAEKAKAFQYGSALPADTDIYDNSALTEAEVNAQKIVAQAAVTDTEIGIRIKVARLVSGDLDELTSGQLISLRAYVARIKDAGVKVDTTSGPADDLKLSLQVKIDALVLNLDGQRIDGTNNEPVQDAVKAYLRNLPFNGILELDKMIDQVQLVQGVQHAYVVQATARYGALAFASFTNNRYVPDAGYIRFDDVADLEIEFITS